MRADPPPRESRIRSAYGTPRVRRSQFTKISVSGLLVTRSYLVTNPGTGLQRLSKPGPAGVGLLNHLIVEERRLSTTALC